LLATRHYHRALSRTTLPGVAVLCYHGIRDDRMPAGIIPFQYLHLPRATFEAHCRLIRECCNPISLDDWRAAENGGPPLPKRPVLMTFDDGYRSVLTMAAPILSAYELPAAVFVCTGPMTSSRLLWFDHVGEREGEEAVEAWKSHDYRTWAATCADVPALAEDDPRALMTPAELGALARMDRIEIGGHTVRHPILARASACEQSEEIHQNLNAIEAWTGNTARSFAYPNGRPGIDYTAETSALVRDAGVDIAFSTRPAFSVPSEPPLERSRFVVLDDLTDAELAHRLTYSWPR
jgi:peptidoglycan/xylan/chitin deacetylase (PgdA/CDA1 family)